MKKVRALLTGIVSLLLVITIFGCSADTNTPNRQVEEKRKLEIEIPDGNSDTMTISVPTGVNEVKYIIVGKGEEAPTAEEIMNLGTTYVPGTEINRPVNEDGSESDEEYTVYVVATTTTGNGQPAISGVVVSAPWKAPVDPVIEDTDVDKNNHTAAIGESSTEGAKTKYLLIEYIAGQEPSAPSAEEIWAKGKDYNGQEINLEGSYYIYSVAKLGSRYSEVKCTPHIMVEAKIPDGNSDTMFLNVPELEESENKEDVEVKYIIRKSGDPAPTEEDFKGGEAATYNPEEGISRPENIEDDGEYVVYIVTTTGVGTSSPAISGVVVTAPITWKAPESPSEPEANISGNKVVIKENNEKAKVRYLLIEYKAGETPSTPSAEYIWANGEDYKKELVLNKSYHIYYVSKLGSEYSKVSYEFFEWIDVVVPDGNSDTMYIDVPEPKSENETVEVKYIIKKKGEEAPTQDDILNNGNTYDSNDGISRTEDIEDNEEYVVYVVTVTTVGGSSPAISGVVVTAPITWNTPVKPDAPQIVVNNTNYTYTVKGRADSAVMKVLVKDYSRSTPNPSTPSAEEIWNNGTTVSSITNQSVGNSKHVYAVAKLGSEYSEVTKSLVEYKLVVTPNSNVALKSVVFKTNINDVTMMASDTKNGTYSQFQNSIKTLYMIRSTEEVSRYIKAIADKYHDSDPIKVDIGLYPGRRFAYSNPGDGKTYNLVICNVDTARNAWAINEEPLKSITWGCLGTNTLASMDGQSGKALTKYVMEYKDTDSTHNPYPQRIKAGSSSNISSQDESLYTSLWAEVAKIAGYTFGKTYSSGWFVPSHEELTIVDNLVASDLEGFDGLRETINANQNTYSNKYWVWTSNDGGQASYGSSGTPNYYGLTPSGVINPRYMMLASYARANTYGAYLCFAF